MAAYLQFLGMSYSRVCWRVRSIKQRGKNPSHKTQGRILPRLLQWTNIQRYNDPFKNCLWVLLNHWYFCHWILQQGQKKREIKNTFANDLQILCHKVMNVQESWWYKANNALKNQYTNHFSDPYYHSMAHSMLMQSQKCPLQNLTIS